ncbi:MAG TPA: FtsX-like permease family protein [Phycisphaerales bacterium]|nr:FtsX-like permease family protein [Phycisphaerales bacterium]
MTDFTIILRSLRARLFSTVVTAITVAVAVGLMLVLLSMSDAGRQAFNQGTGNMHLLVSRDASPMVAILNGVFYANPPQRPIMWEKYQEIAANPLLEWAIPTQQGDSYEGFPVLATLPEFFTKFTPNENEPWKLREGRFIRGAKDPLPAGEKGPDRPDAYAYEVVLGSAAAKGTGLKVGDEIFLTHGINASRQLGAPQEEAPHVHKDFSYRVVGILMPTGSAHDRALFTHLDGAWVLHAHDRRKDADESVTKTTLADIEPGDRKITGIYLRVLTRAGAQGSASLPVVYDQLRRDSSITVAQPKQQIDTLFRIVGNIDSIFVALAAAVMLSSGIGIMLAMYNSMNERRRQVAVLRVLGCSRGRVFGLILTESAMIGVIGAVAGAGLAVVGGFLVAGVLKEQIGLSVTPVFSAPAIMTVVLATVALAAVAGVIPAILAYRTPVANNLRPIG